MKRAASRHARGDSASTGVEPCRSAHLCEWDVTTDVVGLVARQEQNQPRGQSSPSIVGVHVVPHVRTMENCCCCLADATVQPRAAAACGRVVT